MIQSMTGYGKAEVLLSAGKLVIEIRSLNGKSADIAIKSQLLPKEKDLLVRKMISEKLVRGTIDVYLSLEESEGGGVHTVNKEAFHAYWQSIIEALDGEIPLAKASVRHPANASILTNAILRLPDVVGKSSDAISESEWPKVEAAFVSALHALEDYRRREGAALYRDVTGRVQTILDLYNEVESLEAERIETVKARLKKNLDELSAKVDPSRFEQELIFYLEKYDINEEKVRLRQHCKYFMDTIDGEPYPGKKLGFIIQEMGREINTTGSKANHAGIQALVVRMKDELEKIREQSMNIL